MKDLLLKLLKPENYLFIILIALILFIIYCLFSCTISTTPKPPKISCANVEEHLIELQCNDLLFVAKENKTWVQWCEWVQDSKIDELDLNCMYNQKTCQNIEKCYNE